MADGVNYTLKGFDQYDVLLGDELRGERATIGKSLLDVQRDLKIKASYIAAIENCDLEVFSNLGFVAGYVRSYARYLSLDPETVYERFCRESGFSNSNASLTLQIRKSEQKSTKNFGSSSNWKPGEIGQIEVNDFSFLNMASRSAPVILVLFVLVGSIWGALSVLKQVQRLDIVAFEDAPEVFSKPVSDISYSSVLQLSVDDYRSEELALPVFEPRDRALSTLQTDMFTALEDTIDIPVISYSKIKNITLSEVKDKAALQPSNNNFFPAPVVRTAPRIPTVKLLAMTPAWVRIKNEFGDVIFEKILEQGETFLIEKALFTGELRAGNAQNVYFVVDDKVHGPLSKEVSVVKKISLDPESIKSKFLVSAFATNSYVREHLEETTLDTAGVIE